MLSEAKWRIFYTDNSKTDTNLHTLAQFLPKKTPKNPIVIRQYFDVLRHFQFQLVNINQLLRLMNPTKYTSELSFNTFTACASGTKKKKTI